MKFEGTLVVLFIFTRCWDFFTTWYFPGTNVTPAAFMFFSLQAVIGLKVLKFIFYHDGGGGGA